VLDGMNVGKTYKMDQDLDVEWINLILSAQSMGISLEDIRLFLKETSVTESSDNNKTFS
jgi:DNA-binding transcriptional MerR regulator